MCPAMATQTSALKCVDTASSSLRQAAVKARRFGVEFDPETAICYGCKADGKPEGIVVARCDVRACAQTKKHECCIECDELVGCEKSLWKRFPEFKKQVIAMQQRYRKQG